jgi:hypothetical protein
MMKLKLGKDRDVKLGKDRFFIFMFEKRWGKELNLNIACCKLFYSDF